MKEQTDKPKYMKTLSKVKDKSLENPATKYYNRSHLALRS